MKKTYKLKLSKEELDILHAIVIDFDASRFEDYDHSIMLTDIIGKIDYLYEKE